MIHYHGLPITPGTAALRAISGGHAFVSLAHPHQFGIALDVCQTVALDNGAFSAWTAGKPIDDWKPFYEWIGECHRYPSFDFAVIPDVIDGSEEDNDILLRQWPWSGRDVGVGAPVWHMHESLIRLQRLATDWPRICIGSSKEFSSVGSKRWYDRMVQAMDILCDKAGRPICKIHGLRMLDVEIFSKFPFSSADSTNIGRNVGIDSHWKGPYTPASKECRAQVMRERIEAVQAPVLWQRKVALTQQVFQLVVQ